MNKYVCPCGDNHAYPSLCPQEGDPRLPINQRDRAGSAVRRGRNNCRVVVTLEIEVPQYHLKKQPAHLRDTATYMREYLEGPGLSSIMESVLREWLMGSYASILDTKLEVMG
jgi:hypothetical protein